MEIQMFIALLSSLLSLPIAQKISSLPLDEVDGIVRENI